MNIQDEVIKIHSKYGITEKANYEIQLLTERYAKEYHESEVKKLGISLVSQQHELLIGLLTKLENGGGNAFIDKEQIVDDYLKAN